MIHRTACATEGVPCFFTKRRELGGFDIFHHKEMRAPGFVGIICRGNIKMPRFLGSTIRSPQPAAKTVRSIAPYNALPRKSRIIPIQCHKSFVSIDVPTN